MKRSLHLFLVLALCLQMAPAFAKAPDIIIDSKLDYDWSGFLINRVRKLLRNNGVPDPFTMKITEPITVTDSVIESYLDADTKALLANLGNLLGLNLIQGKTKVVIHGVDY